VFEAPGQVVVIKPDAGASIAAWDVRAARHALAAVLRRRHEASHDRLVAAERAGHLKVDGTDDPATGTEAGGAVESIHEIVRSKEPGLAERLSYDAYERRSGLVHFYDRDVALDDLVMARAPERADTLDQAYEITE